MPASSESLEMYLEDIYVLSQELDVVRPVDLAKKMGFSKPTISEWMGKLRDQGYVEPDNGTGLHLTPKGEAIAISVYERHVLLCNLFCAMGVSPETAEEDACRVEHYISAETFECMKSFYATLDK
ncbi:MAG: metal-dependent transcriptional regulator [Coriobacteriaceae bacterium]|nr:metal-dependent transcriptional regulator [Coriobacteriaceae bacterium]